MKKRLIIFGTSALAEIAFEYFTHDSDFEVVAFCANREFLDKKELIGLPVFAFEEIQNHFNPQEYWFFVAIAYPQLNRLRTRVLKEVRQKGYRVASYVSSRAFVWHNVKIGENCFIFEDNTIQPFVSIGDNVIMWSGNHIGHHSTIGDNCFISSHVVISGFVTVGANCFLGVNSTIANNLKIEKDNWVGPGTLIVADTPVGAFFKATKSRPDESRTAYDIAGISP